MLQVTDEAGDKWKQINGEMLSWPNFHGREKESKETQEMGQYDPSSSLSVYHTPAVTLNARLRHCFEQWDCANHWLIPKNCVHFAHLGFSFSSLPLGCRIPLLQGYYTFSSLVTMQSSSSSENMVVAPTKLVPVANGVFEIPGRS